MEFWNEVLANIPYIALGLIAGSYVTYVFVTYEKKRAVVVPEIPHVRVGSQVMIGDDLYILATYHYEESSTMAGESERTAIFKSVPTRKQYESD